MRKSFGKRIGILLFLLTVFWGMSACELLDSTAPMWGEYSGKRYISVSNFYPCEELTPQHIQFVCGGSVYQAELYGGEETGMIVYRPIAFGDVYFLCEDIGVPSLETCAVEKIVINFFASDKENVVLQGPEKAFFQDFLNEYSDKQLVFQDAENIASIHVYFSGYDFYYFWGNLLLLDDNGYGVYKNGTSKQGRIDRYFPIPDVVL